jgi:hypothetical protein
MKYLRIGKQQKTRKFFKYAPECQTKTFNDYKYVGAHAKC